MRMPSISQHAFSMVPRAEIPRASFDRSHGVKTTFDAGRLIPVYLDEALPGDTFNLSMSAFARLATPIFPIMDNLWLDTFFFAVPMRLIWDNFEKFMGERYPTPSSSVDYVIPRITVAPAGGYITGSIADYMGVPVGISNTVISSLPFRAMCLIWNEWFRDQNVGAAVEFPTDDGPDTYTEVGANNIPFVRYKRHDYFTSALPWPQKGDSVPLPLGTSAPIVPESGSTSLKFYDAISGSNRGQAITSVIGAGNFGVGHSIAGTAGNSLRIAGLAGDANSSGMIADLNAATSASINSLRQAFQIQRLLERDARGGTRYTEVIRAHFGVISPDARLQRPEYLGGGSTPISIHSVAQTSETGTTPQGNLSAFGTVSVRGNGFVKSFTEHTYIIGLVCARADLSYQQGLNRLWLRYQRFDFYWPALSHIGEQVVFNNEIYLQGTIADVDPFGYQERYAEYRYKPSMITGLMRSNPTTGTSLDAWHLSQDFTSLPTLGNTFLAENVPLDRAIAVPDEPHFIGDFHFSLRCARPMPMYGVPGMIDHF